MSPRKLSSNDNRVVSPQPCFLPKAFLVLEESDLIADDFEDELLQNYKDDAEELPYFAESEFHDSFSSLQEPLLMTEAYPVDVPCRERTNSAHLVEEGEAVPLGHNRPEFIFVRVIKPVDKKFIGLFLKNEKRAVYVSRVCPKSLLASANIRQGDRVLAVNGVCCLKISAQKVAKLILNATDDVSITLRNASGDPNLVSSTIQKPDKHAKVGLSLRNDRGCVRVSKVYTDGLFSGSLLMPGHRCVEINNNSCDSMRSADVAWTISKTSGLVTVLSRPRDEFAMVLSCEVNKKWWRRMAVACGLAAAGALTVSQL